MLPYLTPVSTDDWYWICTCNSEAAVYKDRVHQFLTFVPLSGHKHLLHLPVKTLELFHTSAPLNSWQIWWQFLFHYNIWLGRFITDKWNSIASLFIIWVLVYRLGGRGWFIVFISAAIRSRVSFHWQGGMVTTTESGFIISVTSSWVSVSCKQMSALW